MDTLFRLYRKRLEMCLQGKDLSIIDRDISIYKDEDTIVHHLYKERHEMKTSGLNLSSIDRALDIYHEMKCSQKEYVRTLGYLETNPQDYVFSSVEQIPKEYPLVYFLFLRVRNWKIGDHSIIFESRFVKFSKKYRYLQKKRPDKLLKYATWTSYNNRCKKNCSCRRKDLREKRRKRVERIQNIKNDILLLSEDENVVSEANPEESGDYWSSES